MSSIKTTHLDGDVSVGRDVAIGGKATLQGDAHIKGSARIEGRLVANDVKVANKGFFTSVEDLVAAYPEPQDGWWAIVGNTIPGPIYTVKDGMWMDSGATGGTAAVEIGDLPLLEKGAEPLDTFLAVVTSDGSIRRATVADLLPIVEKTVDELEEMSEAGLLEDGVFYLGYENDTQE